MIGFLQPLALLGLAAAALPALLHLLQRREPPTVAFPPVRYLAETERRHSRRLRLRHLLLLLLRTAVIVFIVLAAARPVARVPMGGMHAPSALAVIVDNSFSSGAVIDGRAVLDRVRDATRAVVARAAGGDHLWIVPADGVARRMARTEALEFIAALEVQSVRLDLGDAVRAAGRIVADDALPGTVVIVSDLQASALSPGNRVAVPVAAWRPPPPPSNRWIDSARATPALWTPAGAVTVAVGSSGDGRAEPAEVRLEIDGESLALGLAAGGERVTLQAQLPGPGWYAARLVLGADELRDDNTVHIGLRAAPPVAVGVREGAGPFVRHGVDVLRAAGRASQGEAVVLDDRPGPGRTIVFPPGETALTGGVNRLLAARNVGWRFAEEVRGEWQLESEVAGLAGTAVRRRVRLSGVGTGAVLASAGGEPWLVRAGDVVLVGSRMDESWTALPVSAGFVPWLDQLITRIAAREVWRVPATPGVMVTLPPAAATVAVPDGRLPVSSDRRVAAPTRSGVYFLLGTGGDTVGALEVNADARESRLPTADARALRAAFGRDVPLLDPDRLGDAAFGGTRRADLSTLLLVLALAAGALELAVASLGGRRGAA